jgi:hypothetical protein
VAERPVDWEELKKQVPPGTPKPPEEILAPGSLVFRATPGPVDLRHLSQWWAWTPHACWHRPEGSGSSIERRLGSAAPARIALWSRRRPAAPVACWAQAPADATAYEAQLYDTLRRLDRLALDLILIETPPGGPAWAAVHDRLGRAATPA